VSEFELFRGTPHPLTFRGERAEIGDTGELQQPPRAEAHGQETPVSHAMLEFDGIAVPVPVYELSFGRVDEASARVIGRMAASQLVVVSRLAERGAVLGGVRHGFAHPAFMERDRQRRIQQARYAAIPQPVQSMGSAAAVDGSRDISSARRLVNFMPEDMWLRVSGRDRAVGREPRGRWMDVNYDYDPLGRSEGGVVVVHSTVREVTNVPSRVPDDALLLAHTEAILEAVRTGLDPEAISRMVFATGMQRNDSGHQVNIFTGLGYYSQRTLETYMQQVQI
jgi:hypothetical protein